MIFSKRQNCSTGYKEKSEINMLKIWVYEKNIDKRYVENIDTKHGLFWLKKHVLN